MNAGPWLPVPPDGYGGIENIVATLVPPLRELGVEVVLASVGDSTLEVDDLVTVFPEGQFRQLQRPYNQVNGVVPAHQHLVVREVRERSDIDLVHDHVEAAGLATLAALGPDDPPVLHTLHWDLHKHPELYGTFDGGGRVWVNGVSADQVSRAPEALRAHAVGHVHLATPLAEGAERRRPADKGDHVVIMGRITPGKGQDLGVRLAHQYGFDLILAGPVGPYHSPEALAEVPTSDNPDAVYFREKVAPYVDGSRVRWLGTVRAPARDDLVASARAVLAPLRWSEPGGTFVVEALSVGTPVVGLSLGCLPELIDHGRTGFLTDNEEELPDLIEAAAKLDCGECMREAATRFTPGVMAARYLELYRQVLARA
ncbi:glycosyltransferase [Phytohabitans flavus]|uniref:Glycosyl transferase family 1 n=2 Tax=Phytohabitans flavus TaxID=1076124 RepID=A0A6F8XTW4_9ACTN|nr:glycosyl transferase family 1 [Phytohabitans flavus]